ncbi:MAG: hypothetical protein JNL43_13175 [Flavobacteriales bacterium]|nr:hypothetical protein [Flavobacteriales bacterium]
MQTLGAQFPWEHWFGETVIAVGEKLAVLRPRHDTWYFNSPSCLSYCISMYALDAEGRWILEQRMDHGFEEQQTVCSSSYDYVNLTASEGDLVVVDQYDSVYFRPINNTYLLTGSVQGRFLTNTDGVWQRSGEVFHERGLQRGNILAAYGDVVVTNRWDTLVFSRRQEPEFHAIPMLELIGGFNLNPYFSVAGEERLAMNAQHVLFGSVYDDGAVENGGAVHLVPAPGSSATDTTILFSPEPAVEERFGRLVYCTDAQALIAGMERGYLYRATDAGALEFQQVMVPPQGSSAPGPISDVAMDASGKILVGWSESGSVTLFLPEAPFTGQMEPDESPIGIHVDREQRRLTVQAPADARELLLLDGMGRIIHRMQLNSPGTFELPVEQWASGVYTVLLLHRGDGSVGRSKRVAW